MNYKSKRWKKLREAVLRRDGYLCQYEARFGKRVEATTVHHILPAEKYPEYQWEPWNLISLSTVAHNKMHDRESHELTDEGMKLVERLKKKQTIPPGSSVF